MKVRIIVVNDQGTTLEGEVELVPTAAAPRNPRKQTAAIGGSKASVSAIVKFDFDGNPRAFMKKHAANLSGAQKFTLLLARLAKGDPAKTVSFGEITQTWAKMKGVLGKYNGAHALRAKENGWVDSPKTAIYVLSSAWKDAVTG